MADFTSKALSDTPWHELSTKRPETWKEGGATGPIPPAPPIHFHLCNPSISNWHLQGGGPEVALLSTSVLCTALPHQGCLSILGCSRQGHTPWSSSLGTGRSSTSCWLTKLAPHSPSPLDHCFFPKWFLPKPLCIHNPEQRELPPAHYRLDLPSTGAKGSQRRSQRRALEGVLELGTSSTALCHHP